MKTMLNKRISIIIPCYNAEKYIINCLNSILSQNSDVEIICINDGSSDSTFEELKKYHDSIQIFNIEHQGVSFARNLGLENATGDWIWFVDSDDLILDNSIEKINKLLDKKYDVMFFGAIINNNPLKNNELPDITVKDKDIKGKDVFKLWITEYGYPYIWNCIYNKEFLIKEKIIFSNDLNIGEDMAFQIAVFSRAKHVLFCSENIYNYKYLFHESTMEKALKSSRIPYHIKVLDEVLRFKRNDFDKEEEKLLSNWAINYVVDDCFKYPEYLEMLHKVWKNYKPKYFPKGIKNFIKKLILENILFCKAFILYKNYVKK